MILPIPTPALALMFGSSQVIAGTDTISQDASDPAGFFLLLFGLAALLLGMRNLRQLKYKRMSPPRHDPHDERDLKAHSRQVSED